jgi:hypothetical protein
MGVTNLFAGSDARSLRSRLNRRSVNTLDDQYPAIARQRWRAITPLSSLQALLTLTAPLFQEPR